MEPANEAVGRAQVNRRWLVLVTVAIAQLMVVLDATVVNIALPSAQRALGFANSDRQWVLTAYALAFGGLLLLGGRVGDLFPRKRVFITGLLGFAAASAFGGAATSFGLLVTARALQGAFGAILTPAALGTLLTTFTDPRERQRALGVYSSVAGAGGGVGLLLGGFLTQDLSWRWTLYVNLLFAALAVAGAAAFIRVSAPPRRPQVDITGAVLGGGGVFLIVFGFSRAEADGWGAAGTVGSLAGGVVLLIAFVLAERRVRQPLLPLRIIANRARGGAYLAVGLATVTLFGTFLFLTYYLQTIKGYGPVIAGVAFLPLVGALLVGANASSNALLPKTGARPLVTSGLVLGAAATAYLTRLGLTSGYASGVLPALIMLGLAFGLILAPAISVATSGVLPQDTGIASALVNTMQQVGGSIGVSALSTVALTATASYLAAHPDAGGLAAPAAAVHGYTVGFTVAAVIFAVAAALAFALLPSGQSSRDQSTAEPPSVTGATAGAAGAAGCQRPGAVR
ncbi:MAG TPA: MFS transporter [Trebonia sp.]|nr:MFS transporter [Trebonia sp.]